MTAENGPIRVMIVEDDADWIKAITTFLNRQPDMLVVGAATGPDEAVRLAESLAFDVVLMDIQLTPGGYEGIRTAVDILERKPVKLVMLTSVQDESIVTAAWTAGAVNYIDKTRFKELPDAIRGAYRHSSAMDALHKELARLKREEQLASLTSAEREVFELIEQGFTQPQIEKKLFKAERTLKNQVGAILKKLGVRSSKEAVELVRRRGIGRDGGGHGSGR